MPQYDCECNACGHLFEVEQTFEEYDKNLEHEQARPIHCPVCGSEQVEHCIAASVTVITSRKS